MNTVPPIQGQGKWPGPQHDDATTTRAGTPGGGAAAPRVYIDDTLYDDPRVTRLSDAAHRLWLRAIGHCARHVTGGFVPNDVVPNLVGRRRAKRLVAELLAEVSPYGVLWNVDARGGFRVRGYRDVPPSHAEVHRVDVENPAEASEVAR